MLKYIKHHMTTIDGIEIYPIISLIIFIVFFTGLIIYAFTANKAHINKISQYPLED